MVQREEVNQNGVAYGIVLMCVHRRIERCGVCVWLFILFGFF